MMKLVKFALGVAAIATLVTHRRAIAAFVKGEPMPDMPKGHKHCGKKKDKE